MRARRIEPPGPSQKPDDQIMLPKRLTINRVMVSRNGGHIDLEGGRRQPSFQPFLKKESTDPISRGLHDVKNTK